jgi:prepilin peptidase CpaA
MPMQPLHDVALAGFAALMALAAFEDFRRFTIPNRLSIALSLLWPLYFAAHPGVYGALGALGCGLAVFAAGALLFARGWLGGGDVKLLAAAALWAGPGLTPALLIVTGVLGGVLGLVLLSPLGGYFAGAARRLVGAPQAVPEVGGSSAPVPYGVAIAGAALIVVIPPHFG